MKNATLLTALVLFAAQVAAAATDQVTAWLVISPAFFTVTFYGIYKETRQTTEDQP